MIGVWNTPVCRFCCMTKDRPVAEQYRGSHSYWPSAEHASHCGKTPSTIYHRTVWLDQHSTQCAYQAVSEYTRFMILTIANFNFDHLFHSDHTKVIGFSYDSSDAAHEIWQAIERLISNPENISLSVPGRKRKQQKRPKPAPLPQKSQISQPCNWQHVTSVTANDQNRYFSLQAFVGQALNHREH